MKDYFVYLPETSAPTPWECSATACGYTRVRPRSDYPPLRHPVDHHFDWANGRLLASYQIVFITEGRGWFESMEPAEEKQEIHAGSVFLLFPGVWHRYGPDRQRGWVEHWIECRGRAFDRALAQGVICREKPVLFPGLNPELLQCFERCHSLARQSSPNRQAALATLGLHILALLQVSANPGNALPRRVEEIVLRAQELIGQRCQEPLNMRKLARELGEGYSNFRQAFRQVAGISPKQYHIQARLHRAQDLLVNTSKSVKEIAEILGFDSAFHLSRQFKLHAGMAPRAWRESRYVTPAKGN